VSDSSPETPFELHNLHDLGGTATPDGLIQPGRLFRSANPDGLTPEGWDELHDLGIRSIVDLRNEYEVVDTVRPATLVVTRRPIEDQSDEDFMNDWGERLGSPDYYPEVLRRWPDLIASALAAIADAPSGGVLIHCMAGRDRTGMITAMVLELLGVERETIFADYSRAAHEINAWWRIHGGPKGSRTDAELAGDLDSARESLDSFLDEFDTSDYLVSAGVTPDQLDQIRSRLLDPRSSLAVTSSR
jgi:protein-tyrosine phosphatase